MILSFSLAACEAEQPPSSNQTIEMTEFSYIPSTITVTAGEPVTLLIENTGQIEHDFVIDPIDVSSVSVEGSGVGEHHMSGGHMEYDLHVSTLPQGTSELSFTPNVPGTYKIFCSVDGHETAGMIGELVVVSN
jgi:uncharacterized cupredoxin-like copper-binding protein